MASVTADKDILEPSNAQAVLDIVLGTKRVILGDLTKKELQDLLSSQLDKKGTRELNGFVELRQALRRSGDEPLEVMVSPTFESKFPKEYPFDMKSHVFNICRGLLYQKQVWRRLESGETTADRDVAHRWGRDKYLLKGEESALFMRRLHEPCWDADILAKVTYKYTKIRNEKKWLINAVYVRPIPITEFCKHFGKEAPEMAVSIIWQLSRMYSQTAEALAHRARLMQIEADRREMLAERVG